MSLTESHAVYVSAHESALNDLIRAVVRTRPRLLHYASPAFVGGTSSTLGVTVMPAIPFPGAGGIEWSVEFKEPLLDLYDEDVSLAPQLTLDKGQFSLTTGVRLCIDCPSKSRDPHDDNGREPGRDHGRDRPREKVENPICCTLDIQATGELVDTWVNGKRAIGFRLMALELIDVTPDDLESVLECLIGQILRAVLTQVRLPLDAISAGAFTLTPVQGPLIEIDDVIARGSL